jgi:hypothetical protein
VNLADAVILRSPFAERWEAEFGPSLDYHPTAF